MSSSKKPLLIITGASRGIGLQTAKHFVTQGWDAVNLSRHAAADENIVSIKTDLTNPKDLAALPSALDDLVAGRPHISLIHNAAPCDKDTLQTIDPDAFQQQLSVSILAPVQLTQLLLPYLTPGSSVLYVGSTLSEKAVPGAASYIIAKHAVVGMMRASCQDFAGTGVHTACICPGFTDTDMLHEHVPDKAVLTQVVSNHVCFGRLIAPNEIAETLFFAAEHPVLNGAVLHANLGQIEV